MVTCYYPNGDPSKEKVIPCGSGNGVGCCPEGWACQVNGLCFLQAQNYYGRYTCSDKTWNSPGCPKICTHNNTAIGNEAVLQCSIGNFCCDGSRPELSGGQNCCDASTDRFSIDGNVQMTMMSEKPAAPSSVSGPSSKEASDTSTISVPSSSQNSSPSATSVLFITSVIRQDGGLVTTTMSPQSTGASATTGSDTRPPPIGAIAGGALGGAAFLIIIPVLAFLLFKRRKQSNDSWHQFNRFSLKEDLDPMYNDQRSIKSLFKPDAASELEGSVSNTLAELEDKDWEKQYANPTDANDLARISVPRGYRNERSTPQISPLSQNVSSNKPAIPPQISSRQSLTKLAELSERPNSRKEAR